MENVKKVFVLILVSIGMTLLPVNKLHAHVEKTYFLKGKVGTRDLAIKMQCYDEMPTRKIHYFFQDNKQDRYMTGYFMLGFWRFVSGETDVKGNLKHEGTLDIVENTHGVWKGKWTDGLGNDFDVVLSPILADSMPSQFGDLLFIKEMDAYEAYRLSDIKLVKIKTEKLTKELEANWYLEEESGISFFRIRSVNDHINTDNINATLKNINLSMLQAHFRYDPTRTAEKVGTTFQYISDELISIQIISTVAYAANIPLQTQQLVTLDIKTGEQANLEDIVWFDEKETAPEPSNLYGIFKYRKRVFAPKIFSLLQQIYPNEMMSDSCGINNVETWVLPVWNLTNKGILFSFRPSEHCNLIDWAIVPYEKLKPFIGKKYHLLTKK